MASAGQIARVGGHPALDFANTAGWHASAERHEWLSDYSEWLAWLRGSGQVSGPRVTVLAAGAANHPTRAKRALTEVIELRELMYRIFTAIAHGRPPEQADLDRLHTAHLGALSRAAPRWERGTLALRWPAEPEDLSATVDPLVLAAADLLRSAELGRLRQCGNHPCGWLFLDRSKNGSRRWCSSAECGNASRLRRFRARQAGRNR